MCNIEIDTNSILRSVIIDGKIKKNLKIYMKLQKKVQG